RAGPRRAPGARAVGRVAGARLVGGTLASAPSAGWSAAVGGGRLAVNGQRFVLRPAGRLGNDVALAVIPDPTIGRARGWLWALLGVSFALAAAGAIATVLLAGRRVVEGRDGSAGVSQTVGATLEARDGSAGAGRTRGGLGGHLGAPQELDAQHSRELEALYTAALTMGSGTDIVATAEQTLDVVLAVAAMHVGL